jgi:hypothetical protein
MEAANRPEDQAQNNAQQNRGGQRKRNRPSSALPREISRKTTKRNMETRERDNNQTGHNKNKSQNDKDAAKVRHGEPVD